MPKKTPKVKTPPPVRIPKKPTPPDQIPRVIAAATLDDHLEIITRAVMQAGMSWALLHARWDAYRAAFEHFDCRKVAAYGDADIARVLATEGVFKSESKVRGTVHNAQALVAIESEFGSVRAYEDRFAAYADALKDARIRFTFMGDLNVYYWRFRTGAAVPDLEEWMAGQDRDHPRMREMVTAARSSD